eukprot:8884459-Pyramimonas_sp.AAC.1
MVAALPKPVEALFVVAAMIVRAAVMPDLLLLLPLLLPLLVLLLPLPLPLPLALTDLPPHVIRRLVAVHDLALAGAVVHQLHPGVRVLTVRRT